MAALNYQAKSTDMADILSSEGVEFLLSSEGEVPLSSCHGKKICLYFSAYWCRPCKAFTPKLVQLYNSLKNGGKELEIIFISFDRDNTKFEEHFKCMPWLAVPFHLDVHRRLSEKFKVDRIPSLINPLLSSDDNGVSIEEDLIGLIEDYGAEAFPFTRERREELKAIDKAKLHGDRDLNEFELNLELMPWLAIPYHDRKARQDLCRIFDVKEIPALVLIGPDGRPVPADGKTVISLYGARAFPFTESRIGEVEAALRKEGEALPGRVKDRKHEHELKLDMARGYVCDCCKGGGRFWAFSCDVCDYDLHPTCVEMDNPTS
uniref:protein-disulfide reductase n=1 Tax=Cannabis sativa TaxID=3483 RepID=A0A803NMU8_CANSA